MVWLISTKLIKNSKYYPDDQIKMIYENKAQKAYQIIQVAIFGPLNNEVIVATKKGSFHICIHFQRMFLN